MKPRCRWRIGKDEKLQPYRIKVYIVENKRIDGKVKQETIAFLGSIDATWLDSFWAAPDPSKLDGLRAPNWELRSLYARVNFWDEAGEKLARLKNRIGPDMKRIKNAIHAEVPWPFEADRKRIQLLDAQREANGWQGLYEITTQRLERGEKELERIKRDNAESRTEAMRNIKQAQHWTDEVKRLKGG